MMEFIKNSKYNNHIKSNTFYMIIFFNLLQFLNFACTMNGKYRIIIHHLAGCNSKSGMPDERHTAFITQSFSIHNLISFTRADDPMVHWQCNHWT